MRTNLKGVRRRLEALQRASRICNRGVWISSEEVEGVKAVLRRRLGLQPRSGMDMPARGFFAAAQSRADADANVRKRLEARVAMFRDAVPELNV
jgi:hypothetical protein